MACVKSSNGFYLRSCLFKNQIFNNKRIFFHSTSYRMNKLNCVLLVDDDYTSNFLSQIIIESTQFANHIHLSQNGAEALEFLQERFYKQADVEEATCPEYIFLDINMPVMDGFEFLDEFEKLPLVRKSNISIVMLTSSHNKKDMERAKRYNVAGYLAKPLTEEKIKSLVKI
jgi:CheY-like chemotaxis protein